MLDANDLLAAIKRAAVEAVVASKPTSIVYGKVTSVSPLKINVDQKMTLGVAQLILTRNVTNYVVDVVANWSSEITGKKSMTINNALVLGDEVILLSMQGGQKYIVLDRLVIS